MLGRGEASYFRSGVRPDGLNPEAQKADSGSGVLGEREVSLIPTT